MRISSSLAVGSPMARVVAITVATLLLVLMFAGAGIAGSQLLSPPPDEETTFPTGTFVAAEWSSRYVEFNEDGTCHWAFPVDRQWYDCTYAVEGDLYTELSNTWQSPQEDPPASYHWEYEGEHLAFELQGEDPIVSRRATYQEQPYLFVPNPRVVLLAIYDIAAGTELLAGHTALRVVPGDQVPADTFTDKGPVTGSVAAVAIPEGQPITPDLLEAE